MQGSNSDRVRTYVRMHYVEPARKRGDHLVSVIAGDVHREVGLRNQVSLVCTALRSQKFLNENHLALKSMTGPPSGLSTTVKFVFQFQPGEEPDGENPLVKLYGTAKQVYAELGGGEEFLKKERAEFDRAMLLREKGAADSEGFAVVWEAVEANGGKAFATQNDLPFRYALAGESVWIERDGRIIDKTSKSEFGKAFERWPVNGPGELQDIRGSSYVFAILNDPRISKRKAQ